MKIKTIGELARSSPDLLEYKLGKLGLMLHTYANGEDNDPVHSVYDKRQVKSVGNGMTFSRDLRGMDELINGLDAVCDLAAARMREKQVKCTTVQLTIKDENFVTVQRQAPLEAPTQLARELRAAATKLLRNEWNPRLGIRALTVTGTGLVSEDVAEQIGFFDDEKSDEKSEKRERAMDDIRKKFGFDSIKSAGSITEIKRD